MLCWRIENVQLCRKTLYPGNVKLPRNLGWASKSWLALPCLPAVSRTSCPIIVWTMRSDQRRQCVQKVLSFHGSYFKEHNSHSGPNEMSSRKSVLLTGPWDSDFMIPNPTGRTHVGVLKCGPSKQPGVHFMHETCTCTILQSFSANMSAKSAIRGDSINIWLIDWLINFNVLGGNWDPTDKKFSSVNSYSQNLLPSTCKAFPNKPPHAFGPHKDIKSAIVQQCCKRFKFCDLTWL